MTPVRLFLFDGGAIELPRRNAVLGAANGDELISTP